MHWFVTMGDGDFRGAGTRPGGDAMNGNAVMFDAGKILTVGGGPAYEAMPASADAAVIDITGATVAARAIGPMAYARAFAMAPVLPDGKVLVVGGQPLPVPFTDTDAVLVPGTDCGAARLRSSAALHGCFAVCRAGRSLA